MKYKVLPSAKSELIDIYGYTRAKWGEVQAKRYIKGIFERIQKVLERPELLKPVLHSELRDLYYTRYERHLIFMKKMDESKFGIIRVLHDRMDIPNQLKKIEQ